VRRRVFLVGPMGAGKTTVGRQLAKLLHFTFFDLDAEIEARSGADIPWIFDVEGEAGFRKRESAMLIELASKKNAVIATGGGIVLDPENRALMSGSGLVIYLAVPLETLYERTMRDTKRPLLQVADRRAVIDKLVAEREPLYREVAEFTYKGVNSSPSATAEELVSLIQDSL
jgi:shikimate kinase